MKERVDTSPVNNRGRLFGEQVRREVLVNQMMGIVMNGSQVHYGFGLFHRTMESPLMKRDLLLTAFFSNMIAHAFWIICGTSSANPSWASRSIGAAASMLAVSGALSCVTGCSEHDVTDAFQR